MKWRCGQTVEVDDWACTGLINRQKAAVPTASVSKVASEPVRFFGHLDAVVCGLFIKGVDHLQDFLG